MSERQQRPDNYYRQRAKELRELAEASSPGPNRDKLLKVVADYEGIADNVERERERGKAKAPRGT